MNSGVSRRDLALAAGAIAAGLPQAASAAALADSPNGIVLGPGDHPVNANITIKTDILLLPGARIVVAPGRTLTVLGDFSAPVAPVFTGPGRIDLNTSRAPAAHPEWWGAVTGDAAADCMPALAACLAAHPVMHLRAADYFISDTWAIERAFCRIIGSGFRGTLAGRGTRIIVTSGRADVMRVGPAARPATVNDFLQNVEVSGLDLSRNQPVDSDGTRLPAGLRAQYLLYGTFESVSAYEHAAGFYAKGLVRTRLNNCVAFRSFPGRQTDILFRGFLLDGTEDIGLAGGNGSIFLNDCNAAIGGQPNVADPVGLLLDAAFADSFIVDFEVSGIATGIRVNGQAGRLGGRAVSGHVNLHLRMPIVDQCSRIGIEILETSPEARIELSEPYVAPAPGAEASVRCDRLGGAITVLGGQLLGGFNADHGGNAAGLVATDSEGLAIHGLKIADHRRPLILERCRNSVVQAMIGNPRVRIEQAAVTFSDCEGVTAVPHVTGAAGAFAQGLAVTGKAQRISVDATGIDPAALAASGRDRVVLNGRPLAVPNTAGDVAVAGI